jgi:hypothetical protein
MILRKNVRRAVRVQIRHGYGAGVFALENCELMKFRLTALTPTQISPGLPGIQVARLGGHTLCTSRGSSVVCVMATFHHRRSITPPVLPIFSFSTTLAHDVVAGPELMFLFTCCMPG